MPGMKDKFQFTPLREGRPTLLALWRFAAHISIHAPPRGATSDAINDIKAERISIHAPPRGATVLPPRNPLAAPHFNSRPSARGDCRRCRRCGTAPQFQFTPLREGRPEEWRAALEALNFNSRPSARGDMSALGATGTARLFQFTPLREGRRVTSCGVPYALYFNSRPSARGDAHVAG